MRIIKIVVGKTDGTIERDILRVRENGNVSNAICEYGSARQRAYHDVAGITHSRGYVWRGFDGTATGCPALDAWTNMTRAGEDPETWDTL